MAKSHTLPGNVSVADFARALACHPNAIYGARRKGWISFQDGDGLDPVKCRADLANSPSPLVSADPDPDPIEVEARAEAERRRAVAQADREEMRAETERGLLVRRDAIQTMLFSASRAIRDRLGAVAARVAPRVAGSADVAVCTRIVQDEISEALEDLVPESLRA